MHLHEALLAVFAEPSSNHPRRLVGAPINADDRDPLYQNDIFPDPSTRLLFTFILLLPFKFFPFKMTSIVIFQSMFYKKPNLLYPFCRHRIWALLKNMVCVLCWAEFDVDDYMLFVCLKKNVVKTSKMRLYEIHY